MNELSDAAAGQVTASAAEIYDRDLVPALFAEWVPQIVDAAEIGRGSKCLDVACGTGIVALELAARGAEVDAIDINPGMLAVARGKSADVAWAEGQAEALPYPDDSFDATLSQFALMFFEDRVKALSEMRRVTRPGGRIVVSVWDKPEANTAYADLIGLLDRIVGRDAADALLAPYCLGDKAVLGRVFAEAGLDTVDITTLAGTARQPSVDAWVDIDIGGWTTAEMVSPLQVQELKNEAATALSAYVNDDGTVSFKTSVHICRIDL